MSPESGAHDWNPCATGWESRPRVDSRYSSVLLPAVMATAMSLVMSLVDAVPLPQPAQPMQRGQTEI
jgi:hypothetical protein